ncbi:MAG: PilZ domain-containing protein [Candidatus Omnitrophica bacterium]|nr:PilZ domain-containing protein [Candidatus Omnitrophota bacterium]MDD5575046.1 PilZ domain-containing protein [Candidatus Omnitrophota bacterium]
MIKAETMVPRVQEDVNNDHRIFYRNPLYNVKTQIKNVNTGERLEAFVKDISGSGMGLSTSRVFSPGTIFEIAMEIPDGFGPLKLLGRVVWSRDADLLGVRTGVVVLNPRFMSVSRILKIFF